VKKACNGLWVGSRIACRSCAAAAWRTVLWCVILCIRDFNLSYHQYGEIQQEWPVWSVTTVFHFPGQVVKVNLSGSSAKNWHIFGQVVVCCLCHHWQCYVLEMVLSLVVVFVVMLLLLVALVCWNQHSFRWLVVRLLSVTSLNSTSPVDIVYKMYYLCLDSTGEE